MNGSNPTRHVLVALMLSAMLFLIAGDSWNARITRIVPVRAVKPGERL